MRQAAESSTQDLMQQPPQMVDPGMHAGHRQPMPNQISLQQTSQRTPDIYMNAGEPLSMTGSLPESLLNFRTQLGQLDNIGGVTASPLERTKDWQQSYTDELRNHIVQKIIHILLPNPLSLTMQDERMHELVSYVRKLEVVSFMVANSKQEYYDHLAEKIFEIQIDFEEKILQIRQQHRIGSQPSADGSNQ